MIKQAGELDRRITLQGVSTSTDAFGQRVATYSTLAEVWANVVESGGAEGEEGDMVAATHKVAFTIRYRADVNERMRVVYNGVTYKILSVTPLDARKAFTKIVARYSDAA